MNKTALLSAIAASIFSFSAQAENFYVEASVGNAEIASESDISAGLLGGYTFFDQSQVKVSAEAGYNKYASLEDDSAFGKITQDISSFSLGTKVSYSPVAKLDLFGRLAYEQVTVDVENNFIGNLSASSDEVTYALGASYEVVNNFALGTQYKYASLDGDTDLSNLSVTANYKF